MQITNPHDIVKDSSMLPSKPNLLARDAYTASSRKVVDSCALLIAENVFTLANALKEISASTTMTGRIKKTLNVM